LFVFLVSKNKIFINIIFFKKRCAPYGCSAVNNTACTPSSIYSDATIASMINTQSCNSTCAPAGYTKCSKSSIASVFAKGISSGAIKAIYCNDKYMVIFSNGQPNHNTTLANVPKPVSNK